MVKGCVLVVEDDRTVLRGLERFLEDGDYLPLSYQSSVEALDAIEGGLKFGLALVDLSLPKIGGDEVVRRIRQRYSQVPIICISAYEHVPLGATTVVHKEALLLAPDSFMNTINDLYKD